MTLDEGSASRKVNFLCFERTAGVDQTKQPLPGK